MSFILYKWSIIIIIWKQFRWGWIGMSRARMTTLVSFFFNYLLFICFLGVLLVGAITSIFLRNSGMPHARMRTLASLSFQVFSLLFSVVMVSRQLWVGQGICYLSFLGHQNSPIFFISIKMIALRALLNCSCAPIYFFHVPFIICNKLVEISLWSLVGSPCQDMLCTGLTDFVSFMSYLSLSKSHVKNITLNFGNISMEHWTWWECVLSKNYMRGRGCNSKITDEREREKTCPLNFHTEVGNLMIEKVN